MRTRSKLFVAAIAAIAMLAVAVSSASAGRLSTSEQEFEVIWNAAQGGGKTALNFLAGGRTVSCNVTLLGRFDARTIRKLSARIGAIRHVDIGSPCTGGTATALTETLPWAVNYVSFAGTLPNITRIRLNLLGVRFKVHPEGLPECLAGTESGHPAAGEVNLSGGDTVSLRADETVGIPLSGGFLCSIGGEGNFSGLALVRNLPNTRDLTITLI